MFPGLPTRAVDEKIQPLIESPGTTQHGPQPTDHFSGQASPDYGALAGRTENESTLSFQPSGMHTNGSASVYSKVGTDLNGEGRKSNTSIDICLPSAAKINGHTWGPPIETEIGKPEHQATADQSILTVSEQDGDLTGTFQKAQAQDVDTHPQLTTPQSTKANENDFATFLPLGVLSQKDATGRFVAEIELLELNFWIRTQEMNGNVRIYVDAKLTSRNNTPKSIKKLRTALKVLMSNIDTSIESWKGERNAISKVSDDEEDESLWYIFNTLQDPNPRPDLIKDKWAQHAMLDLMSDDDFSEFGLKTQLHPYQRRSAAVMVQREVQPAQVLDPRLQVYRTPTGKEYYYDREDAYISLEKPLYSEACGG
ncbi:uncharacterized protein N7469_003361 [Penicillium citrinum]|uniref:Uncharacterized protein n=1 Tax=Penicillium citrinum TaxID=5077 RepID=A0A9W9P561_PENCI|nr:uncharacterized protein N7469_003361 [Penicillium citrinum]KAJ5234193.1 hypothetical protein N7469_003361 [Penicillium citrinum]